MDNPTIAFIKLTILGQNEAYQNITFDSGLDFASIFDNWRIAVS